MAESSYLRMVAALRILLLGLGCVMAYFIGQVNVSEQIFWLRQTAEMEASYQHEKLANQDMDKLLDSNPSHSPHAIAFDARMRAQSALNLNQTEEFCHSFDRSELSGLLMFFLLQFSLLGGYLTFWYFIRNPNAALLALMVKLGHKRGTLFT